MRSGTDTGSAPATNSSARRMMGVARSNPVAASISGNAGELFTSKTFECPSTSSRSTAATSNPTSLVAFSAVAL